MTDDVLQMTGLIEQHRALGAKLTDFGGWLMPLEYSGVIAEHTAVRTAAGMFDVSHMCPVQVSGPGAHDFANLMFTNDIGRITTGQAQYSLLCDESGGIVDDLLVYRGDTDEFHIIANAGNGATVVEILRANAPAGIVVDDRRPVSVIIAVQGPRSQESLAAAGISVELEYMSSTVIHHATWGFLVVSRTGYTGEKGYEVIIGRDHGPALWDALAGAGVAPCGLGARDTLRLEMGYPLHGNDISLQINPVQARLGWAIGWD
ncbi:MAG: glycine cleavage system aminomethyltransferase GcvT, partial [Actinomycetes bacterium]